MRVERSHLQTDKQEKSHLNGHDRGPRFLNGLVSVESSLRQASQPQNLLPIVGDGKLLGLEDRPAEMDAAYDARTPANLSDKGQRGPEKMIVVAGDGRMQIPVKGEKYFTFKDPIIQPIPHSPK